MRISGRGEVAVTCIACGAEIPRSEAREYDKHGDRWERRRKEFEYLCKDCHGDCCHQPRDGLEDLLADAGAGERPQAEFLQHFAALASEREDAEEQ
jgi:hypothetical protein